MKKILLFGLCLLSAGLIRAQNAHPEILQVHMDKEIYVTGDNVWYQVLVQQESENDVSSKIIHAELLDRSGKILIHQKLKVENGLAIGDFVIPLDWKEDYYLFRAYTLWNLNFDPQFVWQRYIPVYNLLQSLPEPIALNASPDVSPVFSDTELHFESIGLAAQYMPRDSIQVEIQVTDGAGNPIQGGFSLSVVQTGQIPVNSQSALWPEGSYEFKDRFKAEQNLVLRATMHDRLFEKPIHSPFLVVYSVETQLFQIDQAHKGQIELGFPDFSGRTTLQVFDRAATENYIPDLRITPISRWVHSQAQIGEKPPHNPEIDQYLRLARERRDLEQLFELPLPKSILPKLSQVDHLKPDRSYTIRDYIPFDDLETFVTEAIPVVRIEPVLADKTLTDLEGFEKETVRQMLQTLDDPEELLATKKFIDEVVPSFRRRLQNQRTFRLMEEESNQRFFGPPMFIIDNYISFDSEDVFEVVWKDVERIELFTLNRTLGELFGPIGFNGVFAIYTRKKLAPDLIRNSNHNLDFEGFYPPRRFEQFPDEAERDKLPSVSPMVYWEGALRTDESGKLILSFPHNDLSGDFEILLQGMSDQGKKGVFVLKYKVDPAP